MIDQEALERAFREEAEELLREMERCALDLDLRLDPGLVQEMFRCAHTLKGSASCVGHERLMALAHEVEALFEAVTTHKRALGRDLAPLALLAVDALGRCARMPNFDDPAPSAEERAFVARITAWLTSTEAVEVEPALAEAPEAAASKRSLRVDVARLDALLNLVGEVAIAQGRVASTVSATQDEAALSSLQDFQGLFLTLQETVMRLRLVPLDPLFDRYRRATRDIAEQAGKRAELVIEGGDVEVDVTLVEALRDPLTHMVRNAIDHGIEFPAQRNAAGKSPVGRVTLRARYDGNFVVVEVSDDGSGMDVKKLVEKAKALGISTGDGPFRTAQDLAFAPGLSTSSEVTRLSGRGIGMDVVRRAIEGLRGSVSLDSRPGKGVTVAIRVPLTVAVIQGFAVDVGAEVYILPLDSVRECLDFDADATVQSDVGGVIELRGRPLPFVTLSRQLGACARTSSRRSIVVLEHAGERAGLQVDGLLGEIQTVIKPLGPLFQQLDEIAGAAILPDGRVSLVLDVANLLRRTQACCHQ
ncbi:MAG TPA: chemotaxis protein CheW [Polyangiaceae bacterium]|jgi:two-component system chemotaxis sensor kinase CheA|nr:chemotaxis protein CheW [Polyangiaceae bacterium]